MSEKQAEKAPAAETEEGTDKGTDTDQRTDSSGRVLNEWEADPPASEADDES